MLQPRNACERCWDRDASNIISRRCVQFRWSAVFRRCCHRRLPLVHRLLPGGDLLHELVTTATWSPTTVDGKDVRLITGFLPEHGSTRYSSTPSITTVWSNYQTSYNDFFEVYNDFFEVYNDFFEVYIIETVTLSPWSFRPIQLFNQCLNKVMWPIVLCPHWSKSPSADVRYDNS